MDNARKAALTRLTGSDGWQVAMELAKETIATMTAAAMKDDINFTRQMRKVQAATEFLEQFKKQIEAAQDFTSTDEGFNEVATD